MDNGWKLMDVPESYTCMFEGPVFVKTDTEDGLIIYTESMFCSYVLFMSMLGKRSSAAPIKWEFVNS